MWPFGVCSWAWERLEKIKPETKTAKHRNACVIGKEILGASDQRAAREGP